MPLDNLSSGLHPCRAQLQRLDLRNNHDTDEIALMLRLVCAFVVHKLLKQALRLLNFFSCSTHLSMKFQLLITAFLAFKLSDVVFIML